LGVDLQRTLRETGLSGEALSAVEMLGRLLLFQKRQNYPTVRESIAALERLRRKAAALRAELETCSTMDIGYIDIQYHKGDCDLFTKAADGLSTLPMVGVHPTIRVSSRRAGGSCAAIEGPAGIKPIRSTPSLVQRVSSDLSAMEYATERQVAALRSEKFADIRDEIAGALRYLFERFDIPFNRSKHSPAVRTTHALMNIVGPTKLSIAESQVRAAVNNPLKNYSALLVMAPLSFLFYHLGADCISFIEDVNAGIEPRKSPILNDLIRRGDIKAVAAGLKAAIKPRKPPIEDPR
jgi:hypothetical protein